MAIEDLWYKNAIIYCLDVEKYMDTDGDGVGDFEGLSRRLDYLSGLGVTCVWLQPPTRRAATPSTCRLTATAGSAWAPPTTRSIALGSRRLAQLRDP